MSLPLRSGSMPAVFLSLLLAFFASVTANAQPAPDVPYVPTSSEVVKGMLKLAKVNKNDMVYDLGCGDGRIVIAAAKNYGAKGVGIDLNPKLIAKARANAKKAGVENRVRFETGDLFKANFSDASVVTLYLLPSINQKLRPQLWKQLKVGSRVVSHGFDMGTAWPAEKTVQVNGTTIYYWTIREEHKKAAI